MGVFFEKVELDTGQAFRLLKWKNKVSQVDVCLGRGKSRRIPGAGEQWHFHPEVELTLITKGSGIRFVGDHIESFSAPDLVLIGTNLPHYWSDLQNSSGYAIQFSIEKSNPLWQLKETMTLRDLCREASMGIRYEKTLAESLVTTFTEMERQGPAQQLSLFIKILHDLSCCPKPKRMALSTKDFSISVTAQHLHGLSKAILYLLSEFDRDIEFENLLHITHMSKSTFCRQFRRHTGKTFKEFLNEIRIDHSRRLLVDTLEPITRIAYLSGFKNLSHFNRKFLEHCQLTPRVFRARFKGV